jgi:methylated-DNA-[protein]-cysteine S-methyltransferase
MKSFSEKVKDVVRKIPEGKVLTYKEVAKRAGNEKAARAVGSVMRKNFDKDVPCHRVIPSSATSARSKEKVWLTVKNVGEYNRGGSEAKIKLLRKEGAVE